MLICRKNSILHFYDLADFLFVILLVGPACSKFELPPMLEEKLKRDWAVQALLLRQEDVRGKYKQETFSGKQVKDCLHAILNV